MNGHFWTRRLSAATATLALAGVVAVVPAAAFASPTVHTKAIPSVACRAR